MPAPDEKTVSQISKKVLNHRKRGHFEAVGVETTGLSPKRGDRVIEIGAVTIDVTAYAG